MDPPRKGHCMLDLFTRDAASGPKILYSLWLTYIENLLQNAEFILVPKCPLFRGSTVLRFSWEFPKINYHTNMCRVLTLFKLYNMNILRLSVIFSKKKKHNRTSTHKNVYLWLFIRIIHTNAMSSYNKMWKYRKFILQL